MPQRPIAALVLISLIALAGCKGLHSFPRTEAASDRLHATLASQSANIESRDYDSEADRGQRLRYLGAVIRRVSEFEAERTDLYTTRLTAAEAEQIDLAVANMVKILETLAVYPGRLDDNGKPIDQNTARMLEKADTAESPLG